MTLFLNQNVHLDRFMAPTLLAGKKSFFFFLIVLKVVYALNPKLEPLLEPKEDDTKAIKAARKKCEDDEVMGQGHILNTLFDRLYDLYKSMASPIYI